MSKIIAVVERDRREAADLFHEVSNLLGDDGIGQVADLIRDGEYDEHDAVQCLARHRLETEALIVEWLMDHERCPFGKSPAYYAAMIEQGHHRRSLTGSPQ